MSSNPNAPLQHHCTCFRLRLYLNSAMQLITFESPKDLFCGCLYSHNSHIICTLKYEKCVFLKNLTIWFYRWAERTTVSSYESFLKVTYLLSVFSIKCLFCFSYSFSKQRMCGTSHVQSC